MPEEESGQVESLVLARVCQKGKSSRVELSRVGWVVPEGKGE